MTVRCSDLEGHPPCCISCHDDQDEGYPMAEFEYDGTYYEVCCAVARWLEQRHKDGYEI